MNFLCALKHAESGARIRREAWSNSPRSDDFHVDLIVDKERRLMANNGNIYYYPELTLTDYRARDWKVVEGGK